MSAEELALLLDLWPDHVRLAAHCHCELVGLVEEIPDGRLICSECLLPIGEDR